MKIKVLTLCLFIISLFNIGCTTVEIPAGTNLSPEISSRPIDLGIAAQQNRVLYMTETSDVNNTSIEPMQGGSFKGGSIISLYGTLNFFDHIALGSEPGGYRAQLQILGDTRQNAKEGNFSTSVFYGENNITLKQSTIDMANPKKSFVTGSDSVQPQIKVASKIYGAIMGIRTSSVQVIGLMYYKQFYNSTATGTFEDRSSGSAVQTANVTLNNETFDEAIGLPVMVAGNTFSFQFTPTYITMHEPIMMKKVSYPFFNMKLAWTFP